MKFEDLKLAYGYPLQLQTTSLSGQPERYSCRLMGCLPGRSIILSVPKMAGKLVRFRPGQKIVVRLMIDNGIGVFAAMVETQTADPYPMLHISYPENVTFKGIRSATRVAVHEKIRVKPVENSFVEPEEGFISDISINGCRIELGAEIAEIGDTLVLQASVNILGLQRDLNLTGIVRSRLDPTDNLEDGVLVSYGIEFSAMSDDERLIMYAYVFSHIAKQEQVTI